jgi:hypothetical protein
MRKRPLLIEGRQTETTPSLARWAPPLRWPTVTWVGTWGVFFPGWPYVLAFHFFH